MARRLGKDYSPQDIRTATFKLSHEKWEAFQSLCRGQNRSASDVLLEFVESVLNDESIPTKDDGVALAIANLEKEIGTINSRLDALDSKGDGLPIEAKTEPLQLIVEGEESLSEKIHEAVEAVADELPPLDCPDGWNASQLVLRLKEVNSSQTINNKRNSPDFPQWSAKKDPDGYAWESRLPEGKKKKALFPIIPD